MTDNNIGNIGIISARDCPTCGHHEIGYTGQDGKFHALKTGDIIQILPKNRGSEDPDINRGPLSDISEMEENQNSDLEVWVPDPVKSNMALSIKYGILINRATLAGGITCEIYEKAYIKKIKGLIENEKYTPLPVIFDRFFSSPHLASGNPEQVTAALLEEIEEVRAPVNIVKVWLEKKDADIFGKIDPSNNGSTRITELTKILNNLTLEEFLETIWHWNI